MQACSGELLCTKLVGLHIYASFHFPTSHHVFNFSFCWHPYQNRFGLLAQLESEGLSEAEHLHNFVAYMGQGVAIKKDDPSSRKTSTKKNNTPTRDTKT